MSKYLFWTWHHAKGIQLNSLIRIFVGIVRVALGLLMVWLCKRFIDVSIRSGSSHDILLMIGLLVGTVVSIIIMRQVYYYMTVSANARQLNAIRLKLYSRLFSRQLFDEQYLHSGDITSRMSKDIETVSDLTTSTFPQMVVTGIQLLGAFLFMRSMDERLAWALLILTPFAIVFGKLISRRLRQMTHDIREDESRIQMQIQEGMEQNAVLRALSSEGWMVGRLDETQQRLKGNMLRRARFTVAMRFVFGCVFSLGYIMAFIWGGLQLRNGAITIGVLTSFLQLVSQIQNPILTLINMVPQIIHATASIDRLEELEQNQGGGAGAHDYEEQSHAHVHPISMNQPVGLHTEGICFQYATGDRLILDHFTHDFRPGTKTALMGPTGIGKTTIFRLMLALTTPQQGKLSIYDKSSRQIPVDETTRDYFSFVPQGNTLMSGTIRYNLQIAKPDATDEELQDVLHTAAADFVADLPEGIDTELGERGSGLSEGQAQRIAIARGLLRPGPILLLDEISASLDEQTEHLLYTRLFDRYPQKTMIFITHRPSVSELCNNVLRF